jgi:hypothetical protein
LLIIAAIVIVVMFNKNAEAEVAVGSAAPSLVAL